MIRIDSKTARVKLKPRAKPYWTNLDRGFAIGYRKNKTGGGSWIVRRFANGCYTETGIGLADDVQPADGKHVLTFTDARKMAARAESDLSHASIKKKAGYTVEDATDDYMDWFVENRKSSHTTTYAIKRHIAPKLGKYTVQDLTPTQLEKWLNTVASSPRRNRGGAIEDSDPDTWTDDYIRRRRSTANRVLTILKAALNHAWHRDLVTDASAWQKVKPYPNVDAPRITFLLEKKAQDLVAAASDDFRPIVQAALFTGCRYGELAALECEDFDVHNNCIHLRETKTGKPRTTPLSKAGLEFFVRQVKGKKQSDKIFTHEDGTVWAKSHQTRPMREACAEAEIDPPVGFHALRHTYATLLLRPKENGTPGMPIRFVAEALGNSVRICEKHYAHVIKQDLERLIEDNLPNF